MIYGYARVSTVGQAKNGNSLEEQRILLQSAGAAVIYSDAYTGTKASRPEFDKLKAVLESGDTLIVCKLDRFARSVKDGITMIDELWAKGVSVNILNMGVLTDNSMGRLMRTMLLAFAEFERDTIIERTQEGKAIARQNPDFREGRPRAVMIEEFNKVQNRVDAGEITVKEAANTLGISRSTYYNIKRSIQNSPEN